MSRLPGSFRSTFSWWRTLVLLLLALAASAAAAQQAPPADPSSKAVQAEKEREKKEHHISAKEAEGLFASVDFLLKFASKDSELPIQHPVKRELASRDQVEKYVEEQIREDEASGRPQRNEAVMKKFGLLPRDFDLRALKVNLMREQVAGYYDSKKQTFYLLDWIDDERQRPVMAHELTHALQDQTVNLDKFMKEDERKNGEEKDVQATIDSDEEEAARGAVIEGQAMAVMLDYLLEPSGHTLLDSQKYVDTFKEMSLRGDNYPVFNSAPLYIKEAMTFPYRYGLALVAQVLRTSGRTEAFEGMLRHPPRNTREVMEPKVYLEGERLEPLPVPPLAKILGESYPRYDVGAVGEFDVDVLLEQFADRKLAEKLAPRWRGGYYYAALRAEAAAPGGGVKLDAQAMAKKVVPPDSLALLYVSRWASSGDAEKFAKAYAAALPQRYSGVERAPEIAKPQTFAERVANHTKRVTSGGPVFVEVWGETVLVMESFDDATAARLRDAILNRQEEPAATATTP